MLSRIINEVIIDMSFQRRYENLTWLLKAQLCAYFMYRGNIYKLIFCTYYNYLSVST